jgi:hypothetical protein
VSDRDGGREHEARHDRELSAAHTVSFDGSDKKRIGG